MIVIEQNHLEPETKLSLQNCFQPFFEQAEKWKAKADTLVVTDESQIREMQEARVARLALKDIRTSVEKKRKELKEDSLRKGKAIDGIANVIKFLIEPIEEHLEKQEKFIEIQQAKRKGELKDARIEMFKPFNVDPSFFDFYDLANMPDDLFNQLLSSTKTSHENKMAAAQKAEAGTIKAD